ncbi:MAG TPA: superoxide dismutase family protein [Candidatus Saccharimonadales bacterium]|nr:superoxide dismutase family protein [Candidatus Saccharimonadales bacterium]
MKIVAALAASLAIVIACAPSGQNGRVAVSAAPNTYYEAPSAQRAQAALVDPNGSTIGSANFVEQRQNVRIEISVTKLPPGIHGVHLHAAGKCDGPDFASAGPHFNPTGAVHGVANPKGPHAGDLPNLTVGSDGRGTLVAFTSLVDLAPGASQSLLQPAGTSIVVHANADDEKTDPSGNSGGRIACGIVKKVG